MNLYEHITLYGLDGFKESEVDNFICVKKKEDYLNMREHYLKEDGASEHERQKFNWGHYDRNTLYPVEESTMSEDLCNFDWADSFLVEENNTSRRICYYKDIRDDLVDVDQYWQNEKARHEMERDEPVSFSESPDFRIIKEDGTLKKYLPIQSILEGLYRTGRRKALIALFKETFPDWNEQPKLRKEKTVLSRYETKLYMDPSREKDFYYLQSVLSA